MSANYHFGLVGENVSYSKSADIFKAAFAHIGQSASCDLLSVPSERLKEKTGMVRAGFYRGLSVTIPFKSEVIPYLDQLDGSAEKVQAVNSVCMKDGRLVGLNTDIDGFLYPLLSLKEKTKLSTALVIGYGGAAKGVVYALANPLEFDKIVVAGHNQERLEKAQRRMSNIVRVDQLDTVTFDELVSFDTSNIDLIVNCTPLGCPLYQNDSPFPELFDWPKERLYYDLNYNQDNLIIATARQHGLETIDGSAMLVAQALKSLEHWTGQAIPFEPVYQAVFGEGKQ